MASSNEHGKGSNRAAERRTARWSQHKISEGLCGKGTSSVGGIVAPSAAPAAAATVRHRHHAVRHRHHPVRHHHGIAKSSASASPAPAAAPLLHAWHVGALGRHLERAAAQLRAVLQGGIDGAGEWPSTGMAQQRHGSNQASTRRRFRHAAACAQARKLQAGRHLRPLKAQQRARTSRQALATASASRNSMYAKPLGLPILSAKVEAGKTRLVSSSSGGSSGGSSCSGSRSSTAAAPAAAPATAAATGAAAASEQPASWPSLHPHTCEDGHAVDGAARLEVHLQLLRGARVVHAAHVDCKAREEWGAGKGEGKASTARARLAGKGAPLATPPAAAVPCICNLNCLNV